jgi:cytochrome c-type biogenesis protein CcmH/NrfG
MIGFIAGAALLSAVAMAFVLVPLVLLVPLRHAAARRPAAIGRPTALALAVAAPLLAAALYAVLGRPAAWDPPAIDRHLEAGRLLDQAVRAAAGQGQRLDGEPARLIQQALALDPTHAQALAWAGAARFEQNDYAGAVALWRRVLAQVEPGSAQARAIEQGIEKAEALAAEEGGPRP